MAPDLFYHRPANIRLRTGAGGVVARIDDRGKVWVALIRDRGDHAYVLPKGGVEKGETLEEAAMREIAEEAGFSKLDCLCELGIGERLSGRLTTWQKTHYFLFLTTQIRGRPTDRRDWEVDWFDLNALPEIYWREQGEILKSNRARIRRLVMKAAED